MVARTYLASKAASPNGPSTDKVNLTNSRCNNKVASSLRLPELISGSTQWPGSSGKGSGRIRIALAFKSPAQRCDVVLFAGPSATPPQRTCIFAETEKCRSDPPSCEEQTLPGSRFSLWGYIVVIAPEHGETPTRHRQRVLCHHPQPNLTGMSFGAALIARDRAPIDEF